ncbi:hypothetical protein DFH29DRAFT_1080918 [Suillus ampliporus]|nr:hypothetical protein DFH29DRAFT_1080918 [Suillus ampliporus]
MSSSMISSDFTPVDCALFNICGPDPTPTYTYDPCNDIHAPCGMITIMVPILTVLLCPCYSTALYFTICGIGHCLRAAFRATCAAFRVICAALVGRALDAQLDSMEDDGVHEGGGKLVPLVFCGTWMRPPSPTEGASQSEWSSIQPVSVSLIPTCSSQVACKSAPEFGISESAVLAGLSTSSLASDSKSSSIENSTEAARIAVMIYMPSPVFRCRKDREGPSYDPARLNNALPEYQIGVAQVQRVW